MKKAIRILVADDHKIYRDGIRALLEKVAEVEVTEEAATGDEVLESLRRADVDVVLMDIDMPGMGGIETTEALKDEFPEVKVLAMSMHGEKDYVRRMLEAGAQGYLLKNTGKDEMVAAIRAVHQGDSYFSREVTNLIVDFMREGQVDPKAKKSGGIPLTARELEVLKLIAEEYSNPEIAEKLFISIRTVDTHRRNLLEKTGARNTAGLVKYAIRTGLIE